MDQRIKGQEISVRVINSGNVVAAIDSITTFDDSVDIDIKGVGYLGEFTDRFDNVMMGYSFNGELNLTNASADQLDQAIINKAQRLTPDLVFNVIRTDFYPNGDSNIYTYQDVTFGGIPTTVGGRAEFVKKKITGKCSERPVKTNQLP